MDTPQDYRIGRVVYVEYHGVLQNHRGTPFSAIGFLGRIHGINSDNMQALLEGWEVHKLGRDSKYFFMPTEDTHGEGSLRAEPLPVGSDSRHVFDFDSLLVVANPIFDAPRILVTMGRKKSGLGGVLNLQMINLKNLKSRVKA